MRILLASLICLFMISSTQAQVGLGGLKDRIGNQLKDAQEQHDQQLNDAMNPKPPAPPPASQPAIKSGWITRKAKDGKTDVRLYFAYPANLNKSAPAAALVVLQEWWGLNDDIQQRVQEFAQHGYYAVAPDLYHGQATDDPKVAAKLHAAMTNASALIDMQTAADLLEEEATNNAVVDPNRIASIGWCMGGQQSLLLSIADPRIKATVIFYGSLVTDPDKLKKLQGPVLGIFGANDKSPGITPTDVEKFRTALTANKTDATILIYDNVGHAFASKAAAKMGMYNPDKAKEAWQKTWDWLSQKLAPQKKH